MSMMLLLAVTAAVAASMGYLAARRGDEEGEDEEGKEGAKEGDEPRDPPRARDPGEAGRRGEPASEEDAFADLALSLGDVVTGEHEERWLAGALVAREGSRVVGALFLAPEGARVCAVAAFPPPRREIYWMDPAALDSTDEPPATIELEGAMLRRKGRLPVSFTRVGQGAPKVGDTGIWATYEGGGREIAVVITSGGKAFAWKGHRLEEGEYDRLGKGGDD